MASRIRGITVEIGGDTTKLDKALEGTDKRLSEIGRDLRDLEKRLELDPKNVELLDQKFRKLAERTDLLKNRQKELQKVLNTSTASNVLYEKWTKAQAAFQGQITKTENEAAKLIKRAKELEGLGFAPDSADLLSVRKEIEALQKHADDLRKSMADTYETMGRPISIDQHDRLQRELSETTVSLNDTEKAYEDMSDAIEKAGGTVAGLADAFDEASDEVDDASDAFDEATDSVDDTGNALSTLGDIAKHAAGELLADAIEKVLSSIKKLGAAIWDLDEATEEYRIAQGKLNTAFEAAGWGPDAASKAYSEFYKILGNTDKATKASQLLATLADSEEDLTTWTRIAAGVTGTFGDALPIDGLIKAANETAKTGKVTGTLADALKWAGIDADTFNEGLKYLSTESARNYRIMQTLSGTYGEAADAFYRNNEAVIAARENQIQLDDAMATVGETISNVKNTFLKELSPAITDAADKFSDFAERVNWEELAGKVGGFIENIDFDAVFDTIGDVVSNLITLGEIVSPVITLVVNFATRLFDLFRSISPEAKAMTFAIIGAVLAVLTIGKAIKDVGGAINDVGGIASLFSSGPGDRIYRTFVKWSVIIIAIVLALTALIALIAVLAGKRSEIDSAMNSISNVTSGASQIGGNRPYAQLPEPMGLDNYPAFASGGVFAPNSPMLGVLGDHPTEYEVAAPESMLRDTFLDALSSSGLMGRGAAPSGNQPVILNMDGRTFARLFVPYLKAEYNRLGIDLLNR